MRAQVKKGAIEKTKSLYSNDKMLVVDNLRQHEREDESARKHLVARLEADAVNKHPLKVDMKARLALQSNTYAPEMMVVSPQGSGGTDVSKNLKVTTNRQVRHHYDDNLKWIENE